MVVLLGVGSVPLLKRVCYQGSDQCHFSTDFVPEGLGVMTSVEKDGFVCLSTVTRPSGPDLARCGESGPDML